MIEAFPLYWPVGYKRTKQSEKKHAQFQTSFAKARDGIVYQLSKMQATNVIISANVPLKKDGLPYSVPFGSTSVTDDTGIAVYFTFNKEQKVICCDAYHALDDNMQAIHKTVEALRGIDRWKCSDVINQTFTGFKALPDSTMTEKEIWKTLDLPEKPYSIEMVHAAYKSKAMKVHPDKQGGSTALFHQLQHAYQLAKNFFQS